MSIRRSVIAIVVAALATASMAFLPNASGVAIVAGNLAALPVLIYQPNRKDGQ